MARLKFSKTKELHKNYGKYKPWLKLNLYPDFCGYSWLIDQSFLEVDHYKPKEHYPKLKSKPDNLMLCTSFCNSSKSDYHPKMKSRRVYKNASHYIFNCRTEDIGKSVKVKKDGTLTSKTRTAKQRFLFNETVFRLNSAHSKETRKEYLYILDIFKRMCMRFYIAEEANDKEYMKEIKNDFDEMREICSRRLIFYKLLNIKIPRKIEKLLVNKTQVKFVS